MNSWKALITSVLGFAFLVLSTTFISCNDPCSDIVCKNNGICRDGRCVCADGFDGPICEFKMYEKFIGTWDGTYRCNGGLPLARTMIISPGVAPNEVKIYNLFNQNNTLAGTVEGIDLTIPSQSVNGITYTGNGYVNGIYMVLYLEEKDDSSPTLRSCDFNAERFQD